MTALAELCPYSVRDSSSSSRSSPAARRIENLADRSLIKLKQFRAEYSECFNEIEEIKREASTGKFTLRDASYRLGLAFVDALPSTARAPEVTVDADGELNFDWHGPNGQLLSVCAQSNGKLAYAIRFSASRAMHGYTVMDRAIPKEIMDHINALWR